MMRFSYKRVLSIINTYIVSSHNCINIITWTSCFIMFSYNEYVVVFLPFSIPTTAIYMQQNNQLAYLDMNIQKQDNGTLFFSIYRRLTYAQISLIIAITHSRKRKLLSQPYMTEREIYVVRHISNMKRNMYTMFWNKQLSESYYSKATQPRNIAR